MATNAPLSTSFTAVTPPQTSAPSSPRSVERPGRLRSPLSAGQTSLRDVSQAATEAPSVLSGPPQQSNGGRGSAGVPLSGEASGSERYPEVVEALRNIGALRKRFSGLEARVAALEGGTVDQSQLTNLRELIMNKGTCQFVFPNSVRSCLSWLGSSLSSVIGCFALIGSTCVLFISPSCCLLRVPSPCLLYLSSWSFWTFLILQFRLVPD